MREILSSKHQQAYTCLRYISQECEIYCPYFYFNLGDIFHLQTFVLFANLLCYSGLPVLSVIDTLLLSP